MKSDSLEKLDKIIEEHALWIVSQNKRGKLANLEGWNLDGLNLESANLPFAKLQSASLRNTYLPGTNFSRADLLKVNFRGAILNGTDFRNAKLSQGNLAFSECEEANFAYAILENVNFEAADAEETIFEEANLRGANFKNANLSFSDMSDADLENANFEGAKLEGTEILDSNQISTKFQEIGLHKNNLEMPPSNGKPNTDETRENLPVDTNIVKSGLVKNAVHELFEKVKSDLRFDQIKTICKDQSGIESIDKIDFEHGEIVTRNKKVALKLNFKISSNWSILIDLMGNYIISSPEKKMKPIRSQKNSSEIAK